VKCALSRSSSTLSRTATSREAGLRLSARPRSPATSSFAAPPVAADGSASEPRLYARFLVFENGDAAKAAKRCSDTLEWRRASCADEALRSPLPQFWVIKSFVPHCFHGRDRAGRLVIYQRPAGLRLPVLKAHGLTLPSFAAHYMYLEEYLAAKVHTSDLDSVVKVGHQGGGHTPLLLARPWHRGSFLPQAYISFLLCTGPRGGVLTLRACPLAARRSSTWRACDGPISTPSAAICSRPRCAWGPTTRAGPRALSLLTSPSGQASFLPSCVRIRTRIQGKR